jgi:hypothetical protein
MAFTPESLTEQQMHPFASSSHSSTCWSPSLTVRDFSMSLLLPNSGDLFQLLRFDKGSQGIKMLPLRMTAIFFPCRAVRM